ncbi:MAG: methyltransferase [Deltaproteobacteria bacterium]|nr:methyltransferase [Deltaproteobacteria bacterium]
MTFLKKDNETLDTLSCGDLSILQKKSGYRYSFDAYLLAAFVSEKPGTEILDIGSGCGVIALLLAAIKDLNVTGVEIQEEMVEMSMRSVHMANLENTVNIVCSDIKDYSGKTFDAVVTNPPYRPVSTGRINPDQNKAVARHELMLDLDTLMKKSYELLRPSGRFYIVYPAWRLPDLLSSMRSSGIEPKSMVIVYSDMDSAAEICLVSGMKDAGKELNIARPFIVYSDKGIYTVEMQEVFTSLALPKSH